MITGEFDNLLEHNPRLDNEYFEKAKTEIK